VSTLDNTGELRKVAAEIAEARTRVADRGAVIIAVMVVVAAALWALPAIDNDRYDVSATRWVMAAAAVFSAVVATGGGVWIIDKRDKRRADEVIGRLDAMGSIACHNGRAMDQLVALARQTQIGVGMISTEMEQIDTGVSRLVEQNNWLVADRQRLQRALAQAKAKGLSHSEYWEVYKDAIDDLGSIPPAEGGDGN
jgi:hypothetical protein